jgi:hypothetical protein
LSGGGPRLLRQRGGRRKDQRQCKGGELSSVHGRISGGCNTERIRRLGDRFFCKRAATLQCVRYGRSRCAGKRPNTHAMLAEFGIVKAILACPPGDAR